MSPWMLVLVAAGAAVGGGLSVAWFARPMGRQATTVLLEIPKLLGEAAHTERERDIRRPAYLEFLVRVDTVLGAADPSGTALLEERRAVTRALDVLILVGPADVVEAAQHLDSVIQGGHRSPPSELDEARTLFLSAARSALGTSSAPSLKRLMSAETVPNTMS